VVELERILARLAEAASELAQADAAAVRLLDKEGACLATAAFHGASAVVQGPEPIGLEHSPYDRQAVAGEPAVVSDAGPDPPAVGLPTGCRSAVCVPLAGRRETLGTLHVYGLVPDRFAAADLSALLALADLGGMAIAATRELVALRELETSKAHFIRVATHELRSPVAVAQSLVRAVLKGYAGELSATHADVFGRVSRRLDFLEGLVNDLLDLAAGKAPELAEEEGPVAVNASVGRVALLLQPQAEEKGVALTLCLSPEELVVWGTEEGLDRIFVNLVANAVKYTPSGGLVVVSLEAVGDEVQVAVSDTGIGIPEEALPHLFEEFYRAPNARQMNEVGTGLGLAIVKDLVDRYGGRVEVQSAVGEGTTFTVAFPVYRFPDDGSVLASGKARV
jgi:two-component system phosphate regulon sensor histidine kinase PhoR